MLLAAMLAMVLAAAAPAFAHGIDVGNAAAYDDSIAIGGDTDVQFVDASQFQFALQAQFGDATATASDDGTAEATVDVSQSITQNQANAGLGEISDLNQGADDVGDFFD